jgi:hypothetical protein
MSLPYENVVGKQQDWANMVTNVVMVDTPFLGWLPVGKAPVQAERLYQGTVFDAPATNSHPDGVPVTGSKSAGRNRRQLRSLIQYLTKSSSVTKLTEDYGNQAGVADELADDIAQQTKELSRDIENAFLSAQECRIGVTGTTGYLTRGAPNWIQASAQAVYPVDPELYPVGTATTGSPGVGQISTVATASLAEDTILNILQGIGATTRSQRAITCFEGPSLQRAFNNFPIFIPSSGTTINAGAYPSELRGGLLDRGIKRYASPFGSVDLILSYNLYGLPQGGVGGPGSIQNRYSGLFLHQDMWEVAWGGGGMPKWVQKPYEGGQYEAFCEAIIMLTCWNPQGEGKYAPTT